MRNIGKSKDGGCHEPEEKDTCKAHPCYGCFHWRGESYGGTTCNYIFDEGHRRPCPPGRECTVRRERGEHEQLLLTALRKLKLK